MKWDGVTLADVVKDRIYSLLWESDTARSLTMGSNKEYASYLKKKHNNHSCGGGGVPTISGQADGITIDFDDRTLNNDGDTQIKLTWSMAARHIRAWEYEKRHETLRENKQDFCRTCVNNDEDCVLPKGSDSCIHFVEKPKSKAAQQWEETHLCGDFYGEHCEYLLQAKDDTVINGKKLDIYCPYCTSENKVRKIGTAGTWTGLSPKFCPKRLENKEDNMARKLQFDAAITRDIQSAASDSFVDNIKMIDVSEISPSKENFYEMSSIELLADDIEREGLKHNLVVSKDKNSSKYWLKSGHRRFAAIQLLIEQKRLTSTKVPCYVDGEKSKAESKLDLIMLNATQRKYTDAETMSEYEQLSQTLKELDNEGKGFSGRARENIAKIMNISNGQVGKMDNIKHNAAPEVKAAVESGKMSISTANEVAKLAPEKQREVVEKKPDITSAEVKKMQDKKPAAPPKPSPVPSAEPPKKLSEQEDNAEEFDEDELDVLEDEIEESEPKKALTFPIELSTSEINMLLKFISENAEFAQTDEELSAVESVKRKLQSLVSA